MGFCTKCGIENENGTRFCSACGAALAAVASSPGAGPSMASISNLSPGGKIAGVGASLGLLLFFFPWVDLLGSAKFSGMKIAFQDKPISLLLLAIPATAFATLWFLYQRMTAKSASREGSVVSIIGAGVSLLAMAWLYLSASREMEGMGGDLFTGWYWLSVLASIAVVVGAVKDSTA